VLVAYLNQESRDKRGSDFNLDEWKAVNRKDIPRQTNGCDCGVFLCTFAEYIAREAALDFDQLDMPHFRRKIAYEICTRSLLAKDGIEG